MGNIVTVYRDSRQGDTGTNGTNGIDTSAVRGSVLDNPTLHALNNNNMATVSDLTVTRSSEALNTNLIGGLDWTPGDNITNDSLYSSTYQGQWFDFLALWTGVTGEADPLGGSAAEEITLDAETNGTTTDVMSNPTSLTDTGEYHTLSFYIRVKSGTVANLDVILTWGGFQQKTIQSDLTLTSSFQRVTFRFTYPQAASFSLNPRGDNGAKLVLYGVQLQKGSVATDLINTTTVPVTAAYTGDIFRENENGYLIEDSKTNIAEDSEDLSLWTLDSGSITTATDPFGYINRDIKLVWSTINTILMSHGITYTVGESYVVSLYANLSAGSLSAATVSIGGGSAVALGAFSTSGFTRLSATVVAGLSGDLVISLTSPNNTAAPIITNIQVETGTISSYIRNGTGSNSRATDIVTATYANSAPLPSGNWSFQFGHSGITNDANQKTIFDNGFSGTDEFRCYFENDNLKVKNGFSTVTFSGALTSADIVITYDGSNLAGYKDGVIISTTAISVPSTIASSSIYFGTDSASANAINARLSNIKFYNRTLTAAEVKYISGVTA